MIPTINGSDGDIIFGTGSRSDDVPLLLQVDERPAITVTDVFPTCDPTWGVQSPRGNFRIRVPSVTEQQSITASLYRADLRLDRKNLVLRPVGHANGMSAGEMLQLHKFPLVALDGILMRGGVLEITGLALPPNGEPDRVSVRVDDEDAGFEFRYPLPSAGARQTYWYWPNADYATFKVVVHQGTKKQSASPFYKIEFSFEGPDSELRSEKNTFYIPKAMSTYEMFPGLERLQRVSGAESMDGVCIRGYSDCMRVVKLARKYGPHRAKMRVLDWGCGHGRVIRHLSPMMQQVEAFGIDIDPDNISWAKQNLPAIDFRIGPLLPPTDYPDGSFDLVYGISVMTHLTRAVQIAWLREIERILEPGGLALLTFAGDTSVAFNSQYLTLEWLADYRLRGLGADLPSKGSGGRHRRSHLLQKCRYRSEGGH
jgi:2-polyprenyl-3-methyl-5-hydroxy-6-metoxy-1,4-benzoquinol methylase